VHLAELLDRARAGPARPAPPGDLAPGDRPERPSPVERGAAVGALAGAAVLGGWALRRGRRR
jgi:hypothetical protein